MRLPTLPVTSLGVAATAHHLLAPYAGWVAFATALNAELARRNP